jgi:hypothetical protein
MLTDWQVVQFRGLDHVPLGQAPSRFALVEGVGLVLAHWLNAANFIR